MRLKRLRIQLNAAIESLETGAYRNTGDKSMLPGQMVLGDFTITERNPQFIYWT